MSKVKMRFSQRPGDAALMLEIRDEIAGLMAKIVDCDSPRHAPLAECTTAQQKVTTIVSAKAPLDRSVTPGEPSHEELKQPATAPWRRDDASAPTSTTEGVYDHYIPPLTSAAN